MNKNILIEKEVTLDKNTLLSEVWTDLNRLTQRTHMGILPHSRCWIEPIFKMVCWDRFTGHRRENRREKRWGDTHTQTQKCKPPAWPLALCWESTPILQPLNLLSFRKGLHLFTKLTAPFIHFNMAFTTVCTCCVQWRLGKRSQLILWFPFLVLYCLSFLCSSYCASGHFHLSAHLPG